MITSLSANELLLCEYKASTLKDMEDNSINRIAAALTALFLVNPIMMGADFATLANEVGATTTTVGAAWDSLNLDPTTVAEMEEISADVYESDCAIAKVLEEKRAQREFDKQFRGY